MTADAGRAADHDATMILRSTPRRCARSSCRFRSATTISPIPHNAWRPLSRARTPRPARRDRRSSRSPGAAGGGRMLVAGGQPGDHAGQALATRIPCLHDFDLLLGSLEESLAVIPDGLAWKCGRSQHRGHGWQPAQALAPPPFVRTLHASAPGSHGRGRPPRARGAAASARPAQANVLQHRDRYQQRAATDGLHRLRRWRM